MTVQLSGVFAPVVTTFSTENGELDVASFEANVAAHLAAGLHGIVVTGSTGEAALTGSPPAPTLQTMANKSLACLQY